MSDFSVYKLGDVSLQSGTLLPDAYLAYKTYGKLNHDKNNAILLPTFYTGSHIRNEGFFGEGRAIDPTIHFIISINLIGNGFSISPSNASIPTDRGSFPLVSLYDNISMQHELVSNLFGIEKLLLVTGWSMAGCQAFQWAAQYPDKVANILPFCASAKTSAHNIVFLEGVKAALQADGDFNDGFYTTPPVNGLKAFGRVYAGWAFSQTFYRQKLHRQIGFETAEDLLVDWEEDHLNWDANNLLAKLATWQSADISNNDLYQGDLSKALNSIAANTTIIACDNDLYFQVADNELELKHISGGKLKVYQSPWGHCAASPGNGTDFAQYLDGAIRELIE